MQEAHGEEGYVCVWGAGGGPLKSPHILLSVAGNPELS